MKALRARGLYSRAAPPAARAEVAIKKLTVALASALALALLALLALELWLAKYAPDAALAARSDPAFGWAHLLHRPGSLAGLDYELVPGFAGAPQGFPVRVNALGLRGAELDPLKPPGTVRIAVLGDSTTFGYGVADAETYSAKLEVLLNAAGDLPRCEVLNFGVSGYGTQDEARVLAGRALALDPDLVVLGYNLNDPDTERRQPLQRLFAPRSWWRDTHVWRKLQDRLFVRRLKRYRDPFEYAHDPAGANWRSVEQGFASIASTARAAGLRVVVLIFPNGLATPDPASYRFAALHAQVAAEAEAHGFDVIDLVPYYAELERAGERYLLPDTHPNPRGHALAAAVLAEWIRVRADELFASSPGGE